MIEYFKEGWHWAVIGMSIVAFSIWWIYIQWKYRNKKYLHPELQGVKIPDWAKWVAKDQNGNWYAYAGRPSKYAFFWDSRYDCVHIKIGEPDDKWENTLIEL